MRAQISRLFASQNAFLHSALQYISSLLILHSGQKTVLTSKKAFFLRQAVYVKALGRGQPKQCQSSENGFSCHNFIHFSRQYSTSSEKYWRNNRLFWSLWTPARYCLSKVNNYTSQIWTFISLRSKKVLKLYINNRRAVFYVYNSQTNTV